MLLFEILSMNTILQGGELIKKLKKSGENNYLSPVYFIYYFVGQIYNVLYLICFFRSIFIPIVFSVCYGGRDPLIMVSSFLFDPSHPEQFNFFSLSFFVPKSFFVFLLAFTSIGYFICMYIVFVM